MEQKVSEADRVLMILTPAYKHKADARKKGVGYESNLIGNELYRNHNTIKFIPVIRKGNKETSYPKYLGNRKGLMMDDDSKYDTNLAKLVEDLKLN